MNSIALPDAKHESASGLGGALGINFYQFMLETNIKFFQFALEFNLRSACQSASHFSGFMPGISDV